MTETKGYRRFEIGFHIFIVIFTIFLIIASYLGDFGSERGTIFYIIFGGLIGLNSIVRLVKIIKNNPNNQPGKSVS